MKLAIMQPYFFPYIGYFQLINVVDKFILYSNVNYIKKGWIHRNRILVPGKGISYITAITEHSSSFKRIYEIRLNNRINWKKNLRMLFFSYKRSPYFDEVYHLVESILNGEENLLYELNAKGIIAVCNFLDINTSIVWDNSNYLQLENRLNKIEQGDYSEFPYLIGKVTKKTARILEICRTERATEYINPIGGLELYDKKEFEKYNIKLRFLKTLPFIYSHIYSQNCNAFYPDLSIIDVLMNCGKEGTKELLTKYILI